MTEPAGLSPSSLEKIKSILRTQLATRKKAAVFVFGSRSKTTYRQYSDLDLWIETEPPLTSREISKLYETFEESDLSIKVDVVTPDNCLPEYVPHINAEKKLWFQTLLGE